MGRKRIRKPSKFENVYVNYVMPILFIGIALSPFIVYQFQKHFTGKANAIEKCGKLETKITRSLEGDYNLASLSKVWGTKDYSIRVGEIRQSLYDILESNKEYDFLEPWEIRIYTMIVEDIEKNKEFNESIYNKFLANN